METGRLAKEMDISGKKHGELMTESPEWTPGLGHLISSFCTNLVTFHSRECAVEVKCLSIAVVVM